MKIHAETEKTVTHTLTLQLTEDDRLALIQITGLDITIPDAIYPAEADERRLHIEKILSDLHGVLSDLGKK